MSETKKKPTRGQVVAAKMVTVVVDGPQTELFFGDARLDYSLTTYNGALLARADRMRRYLAYKVDRAYQEGRRAGEFAERELSIRGKRVTLDEVKKLVGAKKSLINLVGVTREFLSRLDAEMVKSATYERGRTIAKLRNTLEMNVERVELFTLNTPHKKEGSK